MFKHFSRTLLTLALLTTAACANNDGDSGHTLRVGATSVTGTPAGSLGWGDREGILLNELAEAGVAKIEYSFFQSGSDVVSALLAGAVDVAAVGDNPALTARGRNADVEILALDSVNGDVSLIGAQGGPTTIQGLAGKTITAPHGTVRHRAARQLIAAAGLDGQIEVRDVPTPESIAGLSSGQIDATVVGGASSVELAERGFPVIDSLAKHGFGHTGATITLSSFTEEHPEFRDAWRRAVVAVNRDIGENFDDYQRWVAETDGTKLEYVQKSVRVEEFNTEPFPQVGIDQLQAAYEFLYTDGAFDNAYSVREWVGGKS